MSALLPLPPQVSLLAPLLVPLALGAVLLGLPLPPRTQRLISLVGAAVFLGAGLWLLLANATGNIAATLIGDWPAPYGIVLLCDRLSALLLTLTGC